MAMEPIMRYRTDHCRSIALRVPYIAVLDFPVAK